MSSHHLTIARATFAASLLRPDVTKINRDELPHFHHLLETAVLNCTPSNIQSCKQWLLMHVLPSTQRSIAFSKYLSSYSKYISKPDDSHDAPSISRQRLHLIYLLSDIFHHAKYHTANQPWKDAVGPSFQGVLLDLFRYTASEQNSRIQVRLTEIIEIWKQDGHVSGDLAGQLTLAFTDPAPTAYKPPTDAPQTTSSASKEPAFMMPSTHGDPALPFYELPAGNFMPHILPNRAMPMRPDSIRPLQFAAGPADEGLINAVKDFLKDVDQIDDPFVVENEDHVAVMDDLGQVSYRDEAGEMTGDTYYGWSKAFCEKMKLARNPATNGSMSRSRSRSQDSSHSSSPRRKRRYSRSSSDRSRSRSRSRHRGRYFSDERSRSISPQLPPRLGSATDARSLESNQTRSPNQTWPSTLNPTMNPYTSTHHVVIPPPSLTPGHMPIPPPRPPNWPAGAPWPPPPPPPPPLSGYSPAHFSRPPSYNGNQPSSNFSSHPAAPRYNGR